MKFVLLALLLLACGSVIKAQSCLTQDDIAQMLARVESPSQSNPNNKLKEELIKLATKQNDLLMQMVDKNQPKKSDQEKLQKLYEEHANKLCQVLKTHGWPTKATVDPEGVL